MKPVSLVGLFFIRFYQAALSPLLGGGKCRFYPTCSEYTAQAVEQYGLFYGILLGINRIRRCGPWNQGGYDPIPERENVGIGIWLGKLFNRTSKG